MRTSQSSRIVILIHAYQTTRAPDFCNGSVTLPGHTATDVRPFYVITMRIICPEA